ncbi:N-alpha-acetyltransferase 40 isoform X1 [Sorghum bicolor]|uniref:N-alpha-acetyltransferase 40 isoform X1 n=1 Tax=Sorghum bicolor TaxID=4558 RepID=UPI000B425C57|nr:N-alpha-acetyltransferase 40 isoform X1 [Sorghum bicolor]|eukprot:XP_021314524.1 N-alpha-acetyltransferase 40 isoform X1 [Sorghum bicolor]
MAAAENKRPRLSSRAEKKPSRKEILERKKATDELIRKAVAVKDHLAQFSDFHKYQRNGLSVYLESGRGHQLTLPMRKYIQNLLKVNMEEAYGAEWPSQEKVKRREMVVPEARYIFVKQYSNGFITEKSMKEGTEVEHMHAACTESCLLGFVHYRFVVEEELPVLYVYELQMEPSAQGKGLGKFMMQLIEQIACKNQMGAVMLTVQKANTQAIAFYTKLRYVISSTSPSRVDPQIGLDKSYEILCKTFDSEAKSKLEVPSSCSSF